MCETSCEVPRVVKACGRCGASKATADFAAFRHASDGLQAWCRPCMSEYRRDLYAVQRDMILERKRKQYARRKHNQ
jgi:ribosomal protein S27AE